MRKIDRYLVRAVAGPTVLAFGVVSFLAVANELREQSDELIGHVLRFSDVVLLCVFFLPSLLPYVVPVTLFFGILMGYGRLADRGEITAMRAAGVSLRRLLAPVVLLAAVLTVGCVMAQDRLQPLAMRGAFNLMLSELPKRATIDTLSPGVMHGYENWRVYFRARDARSRSLHDVDVVRHDEAGGAWVFHAQWAKLARDEQGPVLQLHDGHFVTPDNIRSSFELQELRVPQREMERSARRERLEMTLGGLLAAERRYTQEYETNPTYGLGRQLLKIRHEIADRLSLPFATLALACVGAPLVAGSSQPRRSGRLRFFGAGLVVLLSYYVLRTMLETGSLRTLETSVLRVWIPNLVLFALGGLLFWRVGRVH